MAGKEPSAVVCARLCQQYAASSSAARTIPGFSTTQAITSSPHLGSGIPKTGLAGEKDRSIVSDDVPVSVLGYTGAPVALVNRSGFDITPSHFGKPNSE